MSRASALLASLSKAAPEQAPCWDDVRFIAEMPSGVTARFSAEAATLKALCDACPLFDLCEQTAVAVNATGGWWAGKSRTRNTLYAGDVVMLRG